VLQPILRDYAWCITFAAGARFVTRPPSAGRSAPAKTSFFQPGILHPLRMTQHFLKQHLHVIRCVRQKIRQVDLFRLGHAELQQRKAAACCGRSPRGRSPSQSRSRWNILGGAFELVPHPRFPPYRCLSPSSIRRYGLPDEVLRTSFSCTRKNPVMVWSAARSRTMVLFCHFDPLDLPNNKYFLWCFFSFVLSGRCAHFLDFRVASAGHLLVSRLDPPHSSARARFFR